MTVVARSSDKPIQTVRPTEGSGRAKPCSRTGWESRLKPELQPRIVRDARHGDRVLIATPLAVAAEIAAVPPGQLLTVAELRERLAARFGADRTCAQTAGVFASTIAGAVGDDLRAHRAPRWPVWRLIGNDGCLHDGWALDARYRATRLHEEGHTIARHGRRWKVVAPRGRAH
ncbi:MAG: hypothetical protein ACK5RK_04575 [Betaproteobacteria bacterium]